MTTFSKRVRRLLPQSMRLTVPPLVLAFSFLLSWSYGGSPVKPWHLWLGSLAEADHELAYRLLFDIRLPRLLVACLCGAALAGAGLMTQGLFRNPLASPSVIGISSGGVLGAILSFYFGFQAFGIWSQPLAAFLACILTTLLVMKLNQGKGETSTENLLLIGFAVNGVLSSLSSFVLSLSLNDFDRAPPMLNWMLGTLAGRTWEHVWIGVIPITLALLYLYRTAYAFNVLGLGYEVAQSLGLELTALRRTSVLTISLLVSTTVSIAGVLPFVGLIVPQFTRYLLGSDHRLVLVYSVINGMSLMLLSDLLSRTLLSPREIQVGVLISLIGSPIFMLMIVAHRKKSLL